jgi:hypothetical protein
MEIKFSVLDVTRGRLSELVVVIPDHMKGKVDEIRAIGYEFQADDLGNSVYSFHITYLNQRFLEKFATKGGASTSVAKLVADVDLWLAGQFKADFDAEIAMIAEGEMGSDGS